MFNIGKNCVIHEEIDIYKNILLEIEIERDIEKSNSIITTNLRIITGNIVLKKGSFYILSQVL